MKGGARPNAGRKPDYIEKIRTAVINKSWGILQSVFKDKAIDKKTKTNIALEIAKKTIPQEVKGDLNGNFIFKWLDK